jgi:NitT/TauT family transport system permease protein
MAEAALDRTWEAPTPERERVLHVREVRDSTRRERRGTVAVLAWQAALLAVVLLGWGAASGRVVDRLFFSDPISVAQAFWRILLDGTLWYHLRFTLVEMLLGYVLGASLGLAAAVAMALTPGLEALLRPFIMVAFAVPKVALAPLMILWFGIGVLPKVVLAATFVFFIVFLNTVGGVGSVSPGLVAVVRVMGASRFAVFRKVVFPASMPFVVTALRIGIPAALIGAIVGEFISSNRGVGYLINAASSRYRTAEVFAGILGLLVVVLVMNEVVSALERRALRWTPREQDPLGVR